ncbi:MAG: sensor domain-containing diguanylate cyclase [Nitrospiraceae bacterium]|nr:MAG: sensor domain-containing diguanylate cyclase [Nitrospiraceae bacterium]
MGNILLIDNGSSYVRSYKTSLGSKGGRITSVKGIKGALSRLKDADIQLIIIDSSMSAACSGSKAFQALSLSFPKIILLNRDVSKKEVNAWLKSDLAFPLKEQLTFTELVHWIKKLALYSSAKKENEALKVELAQKSRESALHDYARNILSSDANVGTMIRDILHALKTMTSAGASSLLISDEPFFEMLKLSNSSMIRKQVFKKGQGIAGLVMEKNMALNIKDAQHDKRFDIKADSYRQKKVRAMMCVPLVIHERIVGIIRLIHLNRIKVFSDDDMILLKHASHYVALAVERAFLYEKLKNDELTNLYNMRYIRQAIDMEIERSRRFNSVFSLIFMDMDNFKKVNDRYGHLVGSRVIVEIAWLLQQNVRKLDIVSRYGGDEFVIILPQTSRMVGFQVAERLRRIVEKNQFLKNESYSIRLTASFGVATYPDNAKRKEDLLRLADNAMYSGKFLTKNIVYEAK